MLVKKKILILMSGGVDSSTAAAFLVREGHEVSGVYLKLWEPTQTRHPEERSDEGSHTLPNARYEIPLYARNDRVGIGDPCWASEMRDAARVAAHLGIPFQVWDVTAEYKARVLENFYSEYAAGRTPNPDVLCNSEIKFGVGLERALAAGFDFVASGHYARVVQETRNKKQETNCFHISMFPCSLHTAVDANKDQSYFLWRLTQEQLAHTMFPIGDYTKPQVRAMAKQFGLHNWNKKDSQGVCFLGKIELKEFLYGMDSRFRGNDIKSGPIVDVHGQLLGFHDGLAHFTIGQRHGTKLGGTGPYFVVEKDLAGNALIVANEKDEPEYRAVECTVRDAQLQVTSYKLQVTRSCMARTRYRAPLTEVVISRPQAEKSHTLPYDGYEIPRFARNDEMLRVVFEEPMRAVAPGQSIVFYDGERVIGGGVIDSVRIKTPLEICKVPQYATVS